MKALGLVPGIALLAVPCFAADPAPIQPRAFVVASYNVALDRGGDRIVGRLFGSPNDQFTLDLASLALEKPVRAHEKEAGFAFRVVAGTSAAPAKAAGLDVGPDADVVQAIVQANLPAGGGDVKFMAGKMPSLLGLEVLDPTQNPNASAGMQFLFLEDYTGTGVDATWTGAGILSASLRVTNGWDVVVDNNRARTAFGRVGFAFDPKTAVQVFGYSGAERPDNGSDRRSGVELLARRDHARGSFQVQADWGQEDGIEAEWFGLGAWLTWGFDPRTQLALRFERMDDSDGARAAGLLGFPPIGQTVNSYTATLNWKPLDGLQLRPEAKYDRSSEAVYDGHPDQWTLALAAGVVY